jgi:hypothetical protein
MFAWTERQPPLPTQKASREAMYRRELEDRAALLLRLGHAPAYVKKRLAANVDWDFEVPGKPALAGEVDKLVDGVVRRLGKR